MSVLYPNGKPTTQTEWLAHCRRLYTVPEAMDAWLACAPTVRDKWERIRHCQGVASAPQGRFGLTTVPASVRTVLDSHEAVVARAIRPLREHVRRERSKGLAWDTVWDNLPAELAALGFSHGMSHLIGVHA